jgi:hypothetical protein
MSTPKKVATTVKVDPTLYDEFKILGVKYKLTLQGLIEKTVYRYVNEEPFRNGMNTFASPTFTVTASSIAVEVTASNA